MYALMGEQERLLVFGKFYEVGNLSDVAKKKYWANFYYPQR